MKSIIRFALRSAVPLAAFVVPISLAPGCRGRGAAGEATCTQPDVPPAPPMECADTGASACLCPDAGIDLLAVVALDAATPGLGFTPPDASPSPDAPAPPDGGPSEAAAAPSAPQLGYVIVYVPDVARSLAFYERAFGLTRGFASEAGDYAEMATGETRLAFASETLAHESLPGGFRANAPGELPAGFQVSLVTTDVAGAYRRATEAGATTVAEPAAKPWGQTVAYVRDPDGVLVELASPMEPPAPAE